MKKILFCLCFVVFSQLFAEESTNRYENVLFRWQCSFLNEKQEINFLNLNPSFFNIDTLLFQNKNTKKSISNSFQNRQYKVSNYQENTILGFIASVFFFSVSQTVYSSMNYQEKEIYNNIWERQENEEEMRQRFIEHY